MDQEAIIEAVSGVLADLQRSSMPDLMASIDRIAIQTGMPEQVRPHLEVLAAEVWQTFCDSAARKVVEHSGLLSVDSTALTCPNCDSAALVTGGNGEWRCGMCGYSEQR